ncbi:MAG: HGxxPAAW family protein [Microbacteriaceae bacterium]
MTEELDNHGHSPAAWTAVIAMTLGFTIVTVALFIDWEIGIWAGVALIVVGVPLGFILSKLGYGVNGPKYQPAQKGH